MDRHGYEYRKQVRVHPFFLIAAAVGALAASVWLSSLIVARAGVAAAPPPPLPPIPTPTSTPAPQPASAPATGGFIELYIQFPSTWRWDEASSHWQTLWTGVQWQGADGVWHDVIGWQGTLDGVTVAADGSVVGRKAWWVSRSDLGKGPFRWGVYRGRDRARLGVSEPFDLPSRAGSGMVVEISLEP